MPLCAVTFLLLGSYAPVAGATDKPNIVLLFIDDWAWNGTPVPMNDGMENSHMPVLQMPNVERLAREGMMADDLDGRIGAVLDRINELDIEYNRPSRHWCSSRSQENGEL